jgi:hypothetical protein
MDSIVIVCMTKRGLLIARRWCQSSYPLRTTALSDLAFFASQNYQINNTVLHTAQTCTDVTTALCAGNRRMSRPEAPLKHAKPLRPWLSLKVRKRGCVGAATSNHNARLLDRQKKKSSASTSVVTVPHHVASKGQWPLRPLIIAVADTL